MTKSINIQDVRIMEKQGQIDWKDNAPRSLGSNQEYMVKENENEKALFIKSFDPYQRWFFCAKIKG